MSPEVAILLIGPYCLSISYCSSNFWYILISSNLQEFFHPMSLPETITISHEDLPSGKYNVTIKCPRYGDYRRAKKLYPTDDRKGPGYSVEELVLANQLVDVTDVNGNSLMSKTMPKDIIDRIKPFPIADRQALVMIMIEIFWLGVDQAKVGQDLANEYMLAPALVYGLDKDQMPSGDLNITYNVPSTGTQMAADRRYQGVQQQGCSLEEFLFAMCLQTINSEPVETPNDVVSLLDEWEICDVQFANLVFINQFTLDNNGAEKAKEVGKRYRENFGRQDTETKPRQRRTTAQPTEAMESPAS
jgi:hypothetical protein